MNKSKFYLEGLISGDTKTIKAIYNINFLKIKKFVLQNKGQSQDAEDIFQKALLQLSVRYKKEQFEIHSSFEAYLFTVCKNLWRRELNKSKNRVTINNSFELKDESQDFAVAILEQKRWELFAECLELLSENCKVILKLFFAKVPYSTIVRDLKYNSETVVRQRVFKCKTKLKELVKKDIRFRNLTNL